MTSLHSIRNKRGLSQYRLAKKSGIRASTISRIERGVTSNPDSETMLRLAEVLKVSVATLLGGKRVR